MEDFYNSKMLSFGYKHFVCDLFANWESVKDELLLSERKTGTGNGTIHVFLGQNNYEILKKCFPAYFESVENHGSTDEDAPVIKHFFSCSNVISMLGFTYEYLYKENSTTNSINEFTRTFFDYIENNKPKDYLETESSFKLATGNNQLRPYFKLFEKNGAFTTLIRKLLIPDSAYRIGLYRNDDGQYAAMWLVGFTNLTTQSVNLKLRPLSDGVVNNKCDSSYRPYITAIKSKPFILLAGISGTGKSRIVRELARACYSRDSEEYKAHKPANFEMIQVRPNWHDSTELLGYVSHLNGEKYIAGDFLKFIVKAWVNEGVPHFLCLDEMNLAPVEQYFAEYLSVIETREKVYDARIVTDPILKTCKVKQIDDEEQNGANDTNKDWYQNLISCLLKEANCPDEKLYALTKQFEDYGISIPQNLIVMGTVNMDETTFSFSRKVLDRAMSIEMNEIKLDSGLETVDAGIGKLNASDLIGVAVHGEDVYSANRDVCQKVLHYLEILNEKLEGTPFKVAYRTRNEFLLYVVNNLDYIKEGGSQNDMIATALDEITAMKVLSRIEGDDTKISKTLLPDLMNMVKKQLNKITGKEYVEKRGVESEDVVLSVSLKKLEEMNRKLKDTGYTSYWS